MQSSPLIATVNALCLRGDIKMKKNQMEVTFEELTILISNYLNARLAKDSLDDNASPEHVANHLQNLEDTMKLMPSLEQGLGMFVILLFGCGSAVCYVVITAADAHHGVVHGIVVSRIFCRGKLDVNVMFDDCARFEFTPQIAMFDLFGIRLLHGWVVDPQNQNAHEYVFVPCPSLS
jgi:MINDY deubiquitinase